MSPREIEVLEMIGAQRRTGIKPVVVAEETPKWSRVIAPLAFVVFCLVAVFLNAAQYEVSENVPYAVSVEGSSR